MKNKKTLNNRELLLLLKQYDIKLIKTVYFSGSILYYINRPLPEKLKNKMFNNYSNYINYSCDTIPIITII